MDLNALEGIAKVGKKTVLSMITFGNPDGQELPCPSRGVDRRRR